VSGIGWLTTRSGGSRCWRRACICGRAIGEQRSSASRPPALSLFPPAGGLCNVRPHGHQSPMFFFLRFSRGPVEHWDRPQPFREKMVLSASSWALPAGQHVQVRGRRGRLVSRGAGRDQQPRISPHPGIPAARFVLDFPGVFLYDRPPKFFRVVFHLISLCSSPESRSRGWRKACWVPALDDRRGNARAFRVESAAWCIEAAPVLPVEVRCYTSCVGRLARSARCNTM